MSVVIKIKSPPIGITPPWIIIPPGIIIERIWTVIEILPEIDLFAREKGIPVIHLTKTFNLSSQNFTGHSDFPPSSE